MVITYEVYHMEVKLKLFGDNMYIQPLLLLQDFEYRMSMLDTLNMKTKARMAACEIFSHALTQSQGVALSYIFCESKD